MKILPLDKIQSILANPLMDDEAKTYNILALIAHDKNSIPFIMDMLQHERKESRQLILDMNLELSRTHFYLDQHALENPDNKKQSLNKAWVISKVQEFYAKYKGVIGHVFGYYDDNVSKVKIEIKK